MLTFSNPGHLDPQLISTFGISAKPNTTNPIGWFGTGLKYAVARIIASGGTLTIHLGSTKLDFAAEETTIRGIQANIIVMRTSTSDITGLTCDTLQNLAFTTDLGKNWQPWMVYRELWSNCMDEGGQVQEGLPAYLDPSHTYICVDWPNLDLAHAERHTFILDRQNLAWENADLQIFPGQASAVFYRGIKVLDLPKNSACTYNILAKQQLTEDRTLAAWDARYVVQNAVAKCSVEYLAQTVLFAELPLWEAEFDYSWVDDFSQTFRKVLASVEAHRANRTAARRVRSLYAEDFAPAAVPATPEQLEAVDRFPAMLVRLGISYLPVPWEQVLFGELESGDYQLIGQTLYLSTKLTDQVQIVENMLGEFFNKQPWNGVKALTVCTYLGLGEPLPQHPGDDEPF